MAEPDDNANDLSAPYMQHAQAQSDSATIEAFRRRMQTQQAAEEKSPAPQVQPSPKPTDQGRSIWQTIGAVAGDVGTGFAESPTAVIGGVNDAVKNTAKALDSVAEWLNENVADLKFDIPSTGNETLDQVIGTGGLKAAAGAESVKEQGSTTGKVIREGARFLLGYTPILGALRGAGVVNPVVSSVAAGAAADFITQDPDKAGLANLIQQFPVLQNPVTEYLQVNPDDPEGIKRLKHGVEAAGFGLMTEGVVRGIRALAHARKAAPEIQAQELLYGSVDKGRDVLMVASPKDPLVMVGKSAAKGAADPLGKLAKSTAATETGVPASVTAKGVAGAADDALRAADDTILYQGVRSERVGGVAKGAAQRSEYWTTDLDMAKTYAGADGFVRVARWGDFPEHARVRGITERGVASSLKIGTGGNRASVSQIPEVGQLDASASTEAFKKLSAPPAPSPGMAPVGKDGVYVNFARMNTADDVKQTIADVATAFKGSIDEARRGVQTNAETKKLAERLGMTVEDLLTRQKGQPFNAEQSLAARELLNTSAEKLIEFAKKAASPSAGLADQYNFRRMLSAHHAIQSEVIAARTETARALQAWAIPAGSGPIETARGIQQLIDTMGGQTVSAEFARKMVQLAESGASPAAISNAVKRGWLATSRDMVQEAYTLGLLWSPPTHIVNNVSNGIVAFQQVYERAAARGVGSFLGSAVDHRVADGEALAMSYGMISSLKDAFRAAGKALRTGQTGQSMSKLDLPRDSAISAARVSQELGHSVVESQAFASTSMGRAIDFIGKANSIPGRMLAAGDEFFKSIAYRGEVHAQALRQATQEGLRGPALFKRMAELANNPPESIKLAAADAALYSTFQNRPGDWAQGLLKMRNGGSMNPTFMVLPFIKTPANILRYSFERTPLAPLVGQWRADIAAGGARADLAIARMATGTAVLAVGMDLASSGIITGAGPTDFAKREVLQRQGWQPNSARINGKYFSYNRTDPLGMILGTAATFAEMAKSKEMDPEDFDQATEILAHAIGGISQSVVNKTYFQGITEFLSMIQGAEKGEGGVARWVNRQAGSLVPFSSALRTGERLADPTFRDVNSVWDQIQSQIIGMSDKLPASMDLWGRERRPDAVYGYVYDALIPFAVTKEKDSPIDAEMQALDMSIRRITKRGAFKGAEVDFTEWPKVYEEYVRLAGNELKHPIYGVGAMDYLNEVVTGQRRAGALSWDQLSDGPEGGKSAFIRNTIQEYRRMAQDTIMNDPRFDDFAEYVESRAARSRRERFQLSPSVMTPPEMPNIRPPVMGR